MAALLLAALPAFAADTNVERDFEVALTKGQYAMELRDFSTAVRHLSRAVALKPKDREARVSLGIACSRSGDNLRAREVLQQAVAADATDGRARYELALVLEKLGLQEEAKSQMVQAAQSGDPEASAAARRTLEGTGGKRKFTPKLSGGLQYDSNVILEQDSPVTPGEKNSDWRWVWSVNADYALLDSETAGAGIGYQFYKTIHHKLKDYNVEQHAGKVAGRYELSKTVGADLEYDLIYTSLRNEHYSTVHRFAFRLPLKLGRESLTEPHASYEKQRFFDTPVFTGLTGKNGSNTAAGVSHTIMLGQKAAVSLDYTYDADSAAVDWWSYAGHKGTVSALAERQAWTFFGMLSYYDRKYDAIAPGSAEERHDGAQEYSVGISRRSGRNVKVTLSDLHTINDSNLAIYRYTRNVVSLMVEIRL